MTTGSMLIKAKSSISRLLKQSILELCKASVPHGQGLEIDGIVCVSFGGETDQIVVKVHERLGNFCTVSDATSSQEKSGIERSDDERGIIISNNLYSSQPTDLSTGFARPIEVSPATEELPGGREEENGDLCIRRAAATPIWRQSRGGVPPPPGARTGEKPRVILTPPKVPFMTASSPVIDAGNSPSNAKIKIEREDEEERNDVAGGSGDVTASTSVVTSLPMSVLHTDNLSKRSEISCEHCHLVCASFEELKEHNDTAHGAYTCSYCWRSYLHYTNYALHLKRHRATPSRRNLPIEHVPRVSPIVPLSAKTGHKARCGVCGEASRTHTTMVQHLKAVHDFEHCFTCSSCMEYFPNRAAFIIHRRMTHADVNQCRCERCDVFFTYVEFKVHERECSASPGDVYIPRNHGNPMRSVPRVKEAGQVEVDDENNEKENVGEEYMERLLLQGEEREAREGRVKNGRDRSPGVGERSPKRARGEEGVGSPGSPPEEEKIRDGGEGDGDGSAVYYPLSASRSRSPAESENSRESSLPPVSDPLLEGHSPAPPTGAVHRQTIKSLDSLGSTCPGPFRCQSCFQISEQFEEYEMHCYEMHNRFVCPFCAQSFANKRNLHRHVRKHTGEMPYICVECGEKFYRDDDLRRHKISKHAQAHKSDYVMENGSSSLNETPTI